jgi:hypothetical protein
MSNTFSSNNTILNSSIYNVGNIVSMNISTNSYYTNSILELKDNNQDTAFIVDYNKKQVRISENYDLLLGNISVVSFIKNVEDRLGLLINNERLEKDWDDLREIANKYRELERSILGQERILEVLKK